MFSFCYSSRCHCALVLQSLNIDPSTVVVKKVTEGEEGKEGEEGMHAAVVEAALKAYPHLRWRKTLEERRDFMQPFKVRAHRFHVLDFNNQNRLIEKSTISME